MYSKYYFTHTHTHAHTHTHTPHTTKAAFYPTQPPLLLGPSAMAIWPSQQGCVSAPSCGLCLAESDGKSFSLGSWALQLLTLYPFTGSRPRALSVSHVCCVTASSPLAPTRDCHSVLVLRGDPADGGARGLRGLSLYWDSLLYFTPGFTSGNKWHAHFCTLLSNGVVYHKMFQVTIWKRYF